MAIHELTMHVLHEHKVAKFIVSYLRPMKSGMNDKTCLAKCHAMERIAMSVGGPMHIGARKAQPVICKTVKEIWRI